MTTLNLTLSTALQSTLETAVTDHGGVVWGYAVYFIDGKDPVWTDLVTDAGILSSEGLSKGNFAIDLPEPYVSGKVYFLIQSQTAAHTYDLRTKITTESDLNWSNADTWDLRYDSIEVNLENSADDVGDLTSVNGFGLPLGFKVEYDESGTDFASVGYNLTATQLFDSFPTAAHTHNIAVIDTYGSGPLSGTNRMAISPTESVGVYGADGAFRPADWDAYIDTLKVADTGVVLTGSFNGAKDANHVWHNGGFYSYTLEWHPDWYPAWDTTWDPSKKGTFFLVPSGNSQIQGAIQIWPDQLNNSIYSTLGDAAVYATTEVGADNTPYRIFQASGFATGLYSLNTGDNNQWGDVLAEFLTGFSAGFYGTTGDSFSDDAANTANLNHNWNWDPEYAFGKNGTAPTYFDPYAEAFYLVSNSYGNGYTDNLMREFDVGGPLISLSYPSCADAGKNVAKIDVTIFDDGEMPSGFTQPVINHYIAPDGTYPVPTEVGTTGSNISFVFQNVGVVLKDDTPVFLQILKAGGGWDVVPFSSSIGPLWSTWTLQGTAGNWSLVSAGANSQPEGTLLLTGFPIDPGQDGPYWMGLNVGGDYDADTMTLTGGKTFNIYAELTTEGFFDQDKLAVDGLASITPGAYHDPDQPDEGLLTFTVNFMTASGISLDPGLLEFDPSTIAAVNRVTPAALVAGTTMTVGATDTDVTITGISGQDSLTPGAVTSNEGSVYLGWTGTNPWAQTVEAEYTDLAGNTVKNDYPMSAYTNKVGALNYAKVSFGDGPAPVPQWVQADLDGQWFTGPVALGNGTYTVTMQEYLADGTTHGTTTVNNTSHALTLQVSASRLNLGLDEADHAVELRTPASGGPSGNWVQIETAGASAPAGTVLLLYATNADGELVSRDGLSSGPGVTLEDAVLTSIGVVETDGGADVFQGLQSVYVRDDLQLHFAARHGDGTVEMNLALTPVDQAPVYVLPNAASGLMRALSEHPRGLSQAGFFDGPPALLAKQGFQYIREIVERPHSLSMTDWLGQRFGTVVTDPGHVKVAVAGFTLDIKTNNTLSDGAVLADAQRQTGDAFVYLEQGAVLDVDLFGNSDITNQLGFVRIDIDPSSGARSVAGIAYGDTDDFRNAVTDNLDDGFHFTAGGNFRQATTWTVAGEDGYYAPVLISGNGDIFVVGDANTDGHAHVRMFGQNTFGFEELTEGQGADFDYNDMVVRLTPSDDWLM